MERDVQADILVVAAGFSGALIPCSLNRKGHRVVLVVRRGLLTGSHPRALIDCYSRSILR